MEPGGRRGRGTTLTGAEAAAGHGQEGQAARARLLSSTLQHRGQLLLSSRQHRGQLSPRLPGSGGCRGAPGGRGWGRRRGCCCCCCFARFAPTLAATGFAGLCRARRAGLGADLHHGVPGAAERRRDRAHGRGSEHPLGPGELPRPCWLLLLVLQPPRPGARGELRPGKLVCESSQPARRSHVAQPRAPPAGAGSSPAPRRVESARRWLRSPQPQSPAPLLGAGRRWALLQGGGLVPGRLQTTHPGPLRPSAPL